MLIARQIDPAKQESPWMRDSFEDEYYDGIIIIGDQSFCNEDETLWVAEREMQRWRDCAISYSTEDTLQTICDALLIFVGGIWQAKEVNGEYFFWDEEINPTGIDWIIMSYLNTGTAWEIESRENESRENESRENDWTEYLYCYEDPAKEIYENFGSPGEEIKMHWFDGRMEIV